MQASRTVMACATLAHADGVAVADGDDPGLLGLYRGGATEKQHC